MLASSATRRPASRTHRNAPVTGITTNDAAPIVSGWAPSASAMPNARSTATPTRMIGAKSPSAVIAMQAASAHAAVRATPSGHPMRPCVRRTTHARPNAAASVQSAQLSPGEASKQSHAPNTLTTSAGGQMVAAWRASVATPNARGDATGTGDTVAAGAADAGIGMVRPPAPRAVRGGIRDRRTGARGRENRPRRRRDRRP